MNPATGEMPGLTRLPRSYHLPHAIRRFVSVPVSGAVGPNPSIEAVRALKPQSRL